MKIKNKKQGTWKGGIWYPAKKPRVKPKLGIEVIKPKKLSKLQKYMKLCEVENEMRKIKEQVRQLNATYRSKAQERPQYIEWEES